MRSLFMLLALAASAANAQERLQAIEIRGSKEEKTLTESTDSVTVLRDDGLTGTGTENSLEILNGVPNVQINKNGESFSLRGINSAGVTGYQKDNLASILVDDIFQTDLALSAGGFDLWDMERIEILRGAQSTEQGVNSLAGTILLFHEAPQPGDSGAVRAGLGSYGQRSAALLANGRLGEKWSARFSYEKDANDGFIKNFATGNSKWGMSDKDAANLNLLYRISDEESLGFTARFLRNDQGGTYVQSPDPFQYEVNEDVDLRATTDSRQFAVRHEKTLNAEFSNKLVLTFTNAGQNARSDADGTSQPTAGSRLENHKDRYVSAENLLRYRSGNVKNLLGLHVHDFNLRDTYDFALLFPLTPSTSTPVHVDQDVDRSRRTYAIFDSVQVRLAESHSIQAGLRSEWVTNTYGTDVDPRRMQDLGAGTNAVVDGKLAQYRGAYDGRSSNAVLLPKLAYIYDVGDHHFGAAYTKGYRTGGLSINRTRAEAVPYDPESTDNYELSYKYEQPLLSVGANLFYVDWARQQVQVRLSNDFYDTQVVNASSSRLYGAELQTDLRGDVDTWSFGVGHVRTGFKDFVNNGVDYHGNEFPFAARWSGRIAYWRKWTESFSTTAMARYLGRSYANAENNRTSAEQYYLDLNGQYQWRDFLFEAYVRNALDGKFLIFDGRPLNMTADYQSVYSRVSTPRELGVRLTYLW